MEVMGTYSYFYAILDLKIIYFSNVSFSGPPLEYSLNIIENSLIKKIEEIENNMEVGGTYSNFYAIHYRKHVFFLFVSLRFTIGIFLKHYWELTNQ